MTQPLLDIDNLSIAFRQQGETTSVVSELSLQIAVGETLALVGESGSGKSVTALSVLRLLPSPPVSYPAGDIRFHGQSLVLSRYEYGLLATLLQRPGRVYTRDELLERVWDDPGDSFDRTVDAHIKTLRAKLRAVRDDEDPIRTLRGVGYALRDG